MEPISPEEAHYSQKVTLLTFCTDLPPLFNTDVNVAPTERVTGARTVCVRGVYTAGCTYPGTYQGG